MDIKAYITFLSLDGIHGWIDLESGKISYSEKEEGYRRDVYGLLPDGKSVLIKDYGKYNLRSDLARELRPCFYRYDLTRGEVFELFTTWDYRDCQIQSILPVEDGERFLLSLSYTGGKNAVILIDSDGGQQKTLFETEAYPYGFSLNQEGTQLALHIAGPDGVYNPCGVYAINVMNTDGSGRKLIRAEKNHLYFAPVWSKDSKWLAFLDCRVQEDPAHYYADLCVVRPDGFDFKVVTERCSHYFGTSFGLPKYRGGGSNCTLWTADGKLIYTRIAPGSHPDCRFDSKQRSHEENIYAPELGCGGSQLCLLNPFDGNIVEITPYEEHKWDFRASLTPDGDKLIYTSVKDGESSSIHIHDLKSGRDITLTQGHNSYGADHASYKLLPSSFFDFHF